MKSLRILSLLPAATEIVYLLGLEKYLVGVSYQCDYPPQVRKKIKVTTSEISNKQTSRQINEWVKKSLHRGSGVSHIKEGVLKNLRPNLILTQELCEVCAVGFNQVKRSARILNSDVKIISLEPESVEDILENIRLVGKYTGQTDRAKDIVEKLISRLDYSFLKTPKVLVIEWLDPVMVAGHWVPEMVQRAGGKMLISKPGQKSQLIDLTKIKNLTEVDVLIISPCGFGIRRILKEKGLISQIINALPRKVKNYLIDGNSYMTRPGPRIVDGIEILTEILHPEIFPRKHGKLDWVEVR